jgi:hypothetical protein
MVGMYMLIQDHFVNATSAFSVWQLMPLVHIYTQLEIRTELNLAIPVAASEYGQESVQGLIRVGTVSDRISHNEKQQYVVTSITPYAQG